MGRHATLLLLQRCVMTLITAAKETRVNDPGKIFSLAVDDSFGYFLNIHKKQTLLLYMSNLYVLFGKQSVTGEE